MQDLELECSLHYEQIGHNDLIRSLPDTLKEKIKEKAYPYLTRNRLFAVIPRHVLFHLNVTRTTHVQHVVEGNLLGESAFIINAIHEETIKTCQTCYLVRLDRTVFLNVIGKYPGTGMDIINRFHQIHHDLREDNNSKVLEINAAKKGKKDIVRLLLKHGANPNATDTSDGNSALHYAANDVEKEDIVLLLKFGASKTLINKNYSDRCGIDTPMFCKLRCFEILQLNGHVGKS